jgi:hypothetical protein
MGQVLMAVNVNDTWVDFGTTHGNWYTIKAQGEFPYIIDGQLPRLIYSPVEVVFYDQETFTYHIETQQGAVRFIMSGPDTTFTIEEF